MLNVNPLPRRNQYGPKIAADTQHHASRNVLSLVVHIFQVLNRLVTKLIDRCVEDTLCF